MKKILYILSIGILSGCSNLKTETYKGHQVGNSGEGFGVGIERKF